MFPVLSFINHVTLPLLHKDRHDYVIQVEVEMIYKTQLNIRLLGKERGQEYRERKGEEDLLQ
jgi:hypothetical protein